MLGVFKVFEYSILLIMQTVLSIGKKFISYKLIHDAIHEVINSVTPAVCRVCRLGKTQIV